MTTFVATNYATAEEALERIREDMVASKQQSDRARLDMAQSEDRLQKLTQSSPNGWQETRQFILDKAAENPSDVEWQNLAGRMKQLQTDFTSQRNGLRDVNAAIDGAWPTSRGRGPNSG